MISYMPSNSYFLSLIVDFNKINVNPSSIKKELNKVIEEKLSPKTKENMRKNKSIDDFMKHQIPWIL